MKVLSLLQPYASLCVTISPVTGLALKGWETRSWKPSAAVYNQIRQEGILIHASAGTKYTKSTLMDVEPFSTYLPFISPMPYGAIIGYCTIGRILTTENWLQQRKKPDMPGAEFIYWDEQHAFGDYSPGRYAWELTSFKRISDIPCKGTLNLWECPAELYDLVKDLLPAPAEAIDYSTGQTNLF